MSSATSTEKVRQTPGAPGTPATDPRDDATFTPWHFFVLASLTAATVAVLMSRTSTPEHLILISLTIGAAGAAAAACYRMLAPLTVTDAALLRKSRSDRGRAALEREKALVLRSIKELEFDRAMGKLSAKDFDEMGGRLRARALMLMKQVDAGGSGYRELIERELNLRLTMRVGTKGLVRLKPDTTDAAAPVRLKPDTTDGTAGQEPDVTAVAGGGSVPLQPDGEAAQQACASCGTANDDDAAFCKRCGNRLQPVPS
jgi:hypothetical protein